jgi:hypothetical protein
VTDACAREDSRYESSRRVLEAFEPGLAACHPLGFALVRTVASFGVALGDILPGESSGTEINDDLAALGRLTVEGGSIDRSRER